jgi:hypothetical protein
MFRLGITLEQLLKLVTRLPQIRHFFNRLDPMLREPPSLITAQHLCTLRTLQVRTPRIQYLFQHLIHLRILVYCESCGCAHSPVEDRVDRDTDEADGVSGVGPCGSRRYDMVEDLEHVVKVSKAGVFAGGIFEVLFALRDLKESVSLRVSRTLGTYLIEHGIKEHPQPTILLDHFLELLDHGQEFLGILVDMLNRLIHKRVVVSLVLGDPSSDSMRSSSVGNNSRISRLTGAHDVHPEHPRSSGPSYCVVSCAASW